MKNATRRNRLSILFAVAIALAGCASSAFAQQARLEVVARFQSRPAAPAIGTNGEIYLSMHPFDAPEYKVNQLQKDGTLKPFPTAEISKGFGNVIGLKTTADGKVWMLDMGGSDISPKVVVWSTTEKKIVSTFDIPKEAAGKNPFFQDMAVDQIHQRIYIADMSRGDLVGISEPAFVVIDLQTSAVRRVLEGHSVLQPAAGSTLVAGGKPLQFYGADKKPQPVNLGLNPIAIDEKCEYVYFSTVNPGTMHRIASKALADFSKTDDQLAAAIEKVGEKKTSDGIAVADGTVFLTNIAEGGIDVLKNGKLSPLIRDPKIDWPDSMTVAADGSLYVTIDQLYKAPPFNQQYKAMGEPPYLLLRIIRE